MAMKPNRSIFTQKLDFTSEEIDPGQYVGKRTVSVRPSTNHSRTTPNVRLGQTTKTFIPEHYFRRAGYTISDNEATTKVDALGQRVRERFNEEITYIEESKPIKTLKQSNILKKLNEDASKRSIYSDSKNSLSKTLKQRSASVEVDYPNMSGKRTIIDSVKMKDYESIIRRVIDVQPEKKIDEELIKVPEISENIE